MLKLKSLISEGFAWERKSGKPLPTLSEVQAEYERNLKEETKYTLSGRPVTINKNGTEDQKEWTVTVNGKTVQYSSVMSLISPRPKLQEPRWWDSDGDGKPYEPGDDVKSIKEGSIDNKTVLDLVSSAEDMLQNLRDNMADKKRNPGSVLQREEIDGYLRAYADLLDILSDIGYQAEMGDEEEDDIRGWR